MLPSRINPRRIEAGCDEVGRGCLAGPVVAASVILPADFHNPHLNDSKQLTKLQREKLFEIIKKEALSYAVSFVEPAIIDRINIMAASFLAMERAVEKLSIQPEHLLIDGNRFRSNSPISYTCIVKGDSKNASIAAASVLAKVYRDEYMMQIHEAYPVYQWNNNVGYPTVAHRKAIASNGSTKHHRMSFKLLPDQLKLPL
jgi:ribonuclease HII